MYRRKYYNNKIHTDAEFYEAEKKRVIAYQNNRYATDQEYREKRKEYARSYMREYNRRKKEALEINNI